MQAAQRANKAGGVDNVAVMTAHSSEKERVISPERRKKGPKDASSPFTKAAEERLNALKELLAQ